MTEEKMHQQSGSEPERKGRSLHEWASPDYVRYWAERADREYGARRYRFELLADLIPFQRDSNIRILDIGAGFGALSEVALERFPNAHMVCMDGSAAMLDLLRSRQERFKGRIETVIADYKDPAWVELLGTEAAFDVIISSQAMHGLRDRRARMYVDLYALLRSGGCFLNIDLVSAATERLQKRFRNVQITRHIARVEAAIGKRPTRAEASADIDGVPLDQMENNSQRKWTPSDWTTDLQWLRDAGFVDVDCFWKELKVIMIGGYKE